MPPNLSWGDSRPYAVLQSTLEEDCRQAEEPKQLVDEASRFHLGRQCQHSALICSGALLFSSMLSYREHLTKTAGKLKNRNNLLMKLAGSTWGTSTNTLRSSALALCYSAAEYCAPIWSCSAHTSQVDVQMNHASHLWYPPFYTSPMASSALQH